MKRKEYLEAKRQIETECQKRLSELEGRYKEYREAQERKKHFKPFWVVSVNNYLCGASFSGKELKDKHPIPSFRRFYFIRKIEDLNGFTKRSEITNEDLVKECLGVTDIHNIK